MASARPSFDRDPQLLIEARAYDHLDVRRLVEALYYEQLGRYGFADAPIDDPTEFAPPRGIFLVAYLDGTARACGGLRTFAPQVAEVKKMYVDPAYRGLGLGRRILAELEKAARAQGAGRIVLETGSRNTEALALYTGAGYEPVPAYRGRDPRINRALAKDLPFEDADG